MKRWRHLAAGSLAALLVAACGGSGSGVADGGIGGTGISRGSITAFGSIVVNGRHFDVDSADITVNGVPASQADLEIGYVVRVRGDLDRGRGDTVSFTADLVGAVDDNPIVAGQTSGTLTVMRQAVRITPTTFIDGVATPDLIPVANRVLVSGFRDSGGALVATYIRVLAGAGSGFATDQVVGTASMPTSGGFRIGALPVDSGDVPAAGTRVVVRGDYQYATQRFAVASVEPAAGLGAGDRERVELEGVVDAFGSVSDFTVDGVRVDAGGATGDTASLASDAEVEVEGVYDASGVLVADHVQVERDENVSIAAQVSSVAPDGSVVRFFSDSLDVEVTPTTRLKDDASGGDQPFSAADLAIGDRVEVEGYTNESGGVVAARLERKTPENSALIEAPVASVSEANQTITLLGLLIHVQGASFEGGNLGDVVAGDSVEITWDNFTSLADSADKVELGD